jgi:hypothetical protein
MRETSIIAYDLISVKSHPIRNVYLYLGKFASQAWVVKYIWDTGLSLLKEFTESNRDMSLYILSFESAAKNRHVSLIMAGWLSIIRCTA